MRAQWFRGIAVGVVSAALVAVPAVVATAQEPEREAVAAPWLPGSMARAIRAAEVPGERYAALAHRLATERRADALALADAAFRAAGAAQDVGEALRPETLEELTSGVSELTELLEGAAFSGGSVSRAPGAVQLPDAHVVPAEVQPARDLVVARSIEETAAAVFRLSIQVEVAAREAGPDDPIGGPGDLRAPAALTPLEPAEADATADGAEPLAERGGGAADEAAQDVPAGERSAPPGTDAAPGGGGGAPADADANAEATEGDEGQDGSEQDAVPAEGTAGDPTAAVEGPAEGPEDQDPAGSAEPAALDALPADLLEGLAALEDAVAVAGELLALDILGLESVPFLTADRARLMALAQGLEAGDVAAWSMWRNGRIPTDELCSVEFAPDALLRCDAAYALELLNEHYRVEFGTDMGIVSAYRSYEQQVSVKASRGWLAATPGTSNHGWGVAVDLAGMGGLGDYSSPRYRWMLENGPEFGWNHPRSMRPGGGGPPEPWHFEFGEAAGEPGMAQDAPMTAPR